MSLLRYGGVSRGSQRLISTFVGSIVLVVRWAHPVFRVIGVFRPAGGGESVRIDVSQSKDPLSAVQRSRYSYAWLDPSNTMTLDDWKSVCLSGSVVGSLGLSDAYNVTQWT